MREAINTSGQKPHWLLGLIVAALAYVLAAQIQSGSVTNHLIERQLCLADLRNHGYRIVFPKAEGITSYPGRSEYLYSIISPSGRSLFGVRRDFDQRGIPLDTLVRRELQKSGPGPEEIVSVPFDNVFQCAVSPNERFIVIAGRRQGLPKEKRDGIFLYSRTDKRGQYLGPYASRGEDVRSINVSDIGDLVIYEDKETVLIFGEKNGELTLIDRHAGKLPVLMPDGRGYIYSDGGQLILNESKTKHGLLSAPNLVGAIRVSPDSQFIAFGMDLFHNLSSTQLRICEVKTRVCIDGPKYSDWIAGRETFWIKR